MSELNPLTVITPDSACEIVPVNPPGDEVAVYVVIGVPPSEVGAVNATLACVELVAVTVPTVGAPGAAAITTGSAPELVETFPAASVATAVIKRVPTESVPVVQVYVPLVATQVEPDATPSTNNSTVVPASAVPVNTRVPEVVMLSELKEPKSEPASKSGVPGAVGAVRSMVIIVEAVDKLAGPVLPVTSLIAAIDRRG